MRTQLSLIYLVIELIGKACFIVKLGWCYNFRGSNRLVGVEWLKLKSVLALVEAYLNGQRVTSLNSRIS